MKTITTLIFLLSMISMQAQYTLTAQKGNPMVGDRFLQNIESNVSNFDPGPAGAAVTWDFSSLVTTDTALITIKGANNPNFPSADVSFEQAGGTSYFETTASVFAFLGIVTQSATVNYGDAEVQIQYPMNYLDSFTDEKAGTVDAFGQTAQRSGVTSVEADAYGTLITPEATYNNALRIKFTRNDTDYIGGVPSANSKDTVYYWYVEKFNFPIMTYFRSYVSGQLTLSSVTYLSDNPNIGEKENGLKELALYPNPAREFVNIRGAEKTQVKLYNLIGEKVAEYRDVNRISLKDLDKGVYLINIKAEGLKEKTLRLIKE